MNGSNITSTAYQDFTTPVVTELYNLTTATLQDDGCAVFGGNQNKCSTVIILKRISASVSLIACVFMISVIWLFKSYSTFVQRVILYLTVAVLCDCVAHILSDSYPVGSLCNFQAWLLTFCEWSVLLWICCMTFNLYMSIVKCTPTERFEWVYLMLAYGAAFFISFLPFAGQHYGPSGVYCWLKKEDSKWMLGIWCVPFAIVYILLFGANMYLQVVTRRKASQWQGLYNSDVEKEKRLLAEEGGPLIWYPIVYLGTSLFALIHHLAYAVNTTHDIYGLAVLCALTLPLQGFINAIMYCLNRETKSRLTPAQIKFAIQARRFRQKGVMREFHNQHSNISSDFPNDDLVTHSNNSHHDYHVQVTNITSLSDAVC